MKKSKLNFQKAKVSAKKIEMTDKKVHNLQLMRVDREKNKEWK